MFTWICPQCGREVPPAYNECPDCAAKTAAGSPPAAATAGSPAGSAAPPQPTLDPAPPPAFAPPQENPPKFRPEHPVSPLFEASPPQPPQYAAAPRGKQAMPVWLMSMLFALGFSAVFFGIFWLVNRTGSQSGPQKLTAVVESPAAKPGANGNQLQKYIELTGVRFGKEGKAITITFLLVNHSDSDLANVTGNATIWGSTQKSEEDAVGTVAFQAGLPANGSKELTLPFTTKHKLTDMPAWQNLTVDMQITSPSGA